MEVSVRFPVLRAIVAATRRQSLSNTQRLSCAVTEQGRSGTISARSSSGICKDHGISDLFEDCFNQRIRILQSSPVLSGWTDTAIRLQADRARMDTDLVYSAALRIVG